MARSNNGSGNHVRLRLAVHSLTKILVMTASLLAMTSLAGQYIARALELDPHRSIFYLFDVTTEGNVPAGFATIQLLICALTLAIIAAVKYLTHDRWTGYWAFLALVFLGLAWDEATSVHELLISPTRELLDLSGFFYFAWIIPAFIIVAVFGCVYLRFIAALPPQTRTRVVCAALMFLGAVFLLEGLEGWQFERAGENRDMLFETISTLEEFLEMMALIVLLNALWTHLISILPPQGITIKGSHGRLWVENMHRNSVARDETLGPISVARVTLSARSQRDEALT